MPVKELTLEERKQLDPYKVDARAVLGGPAIDLNTAEENAGKWKPTFAEVRNADYRLNTVTGSTAAAIGLSDEEKAVQENQARDVLHYASFGQHVGASISQVENVGIAVASFFVPPLGLAAGTSRAATLGRIGVTAASNMALTAAQEAGIHQSQVTRTAQESMYTVIGAGVLGAGLGGIGEGVSRLFSREVGAAERTFRQNRMAEGQDVEVELGRQIHNMAHAPVQTLPDVPMTMRLHDALNPTAVPEAHPVMARDDSVGAARVDGNDHLTHGPDTPAASPLDPYNAGGLREQDSINPTANKVLNFGDGMLQNLPVVGPALESLQTWGGRMARSPFQQSKSLAAELLPNVSRTAIAASGKGQHMDLYSRVRAIGHRFNHATEKIRTEGMFDYRKQMGSMTPDQHTALINEVIERGGMSADQAYEFVDQAVKNALKNKVLKNTKTANDAALADFNYLSTLAMRNGDGSVVDAVGRRAGRTRAEVLNPGIERGARAGKYDVRWLTNERGTAETYFPRVFDKQALERSQRQFIEDVAPYVRSEEGKNPKDAAEDLWRHLTTSGDDLAHIDISGSGVNFTKGMVLTDLPDNVLAPYLVNDLDNVVNQVVRRYQRDIATAEHFESPEWTVVLNQKKNLIHEEFQSMVLALRDQNLKPEVFAAREASLLKRMQEDIRELDYGVDEALGRGVRMSEGIQAIKAGTSGMFLGKALFANLADLHATKTADIITKYIPGFFDELGAGVKRIFKDPSVPEGIQREQAKRFGTILQHAENEQLYYSMHATVLDMQRQNVNGVKDALHWMGNATHIASGMKLFNETGKKLHTTDIIDRTIAVMLGETKVTQREITDLGRFSFGVGDEAPMYGRIQAEVLRHSEKLDGINYANIQKWTDTEAADYYQAVVNKYVDTKVLTPDPTTRMIAERNEAVSMVTQFTSFIHAFIQKQLVPTAEDGIGAVSTMFLKLAAFSFVGAYLREQLTRDEKEFDMNKVTSRALSNALIFPSSITMAVMKVADSTVGNLGELFGMEKYRFMRESVPALGAIKKVGKGVIIDGINMTTSDEVVPEEKREKYWMNLMGTVPILNSWLMELPARAIAKTFAGRSVDTE